MIQTFVFSETSPAAAGTAPSAASVAGAASYAALGVAAPLDDADALDVVAELVGATGGTLDVYLQTSPDEGTTWYDAIHFPQLAAGAAAKIYRASLSLSAGATAPVVVGKNLLPALAANAAINGAFCDRARLLMVAGASTSAGAAVTVRVTAQRAFDRSNG